MKTPDKTLITIATYNEIENLPLLVEEIFRFAPEADTLVIDDNSPDGTGRWCDTKGAEDPRVHCLHRPGKLGLGTAIIAGMKYAIEHNYRVGGESPMQPNYRLRSTSAIGFAAFGTAAG